MKRILVVGAGLAGATYARELAEAGLEIRVIDRRPHIGGNCYDYVHDSGVRVHKYGPHLFHTSSMRVVDWLSRFTQWLPYEHRVVARLPDGGYAPMPVNLDTINAVFGSSLQDADDVARRLKQLSIPRTPVVSAEDHLLSTIGPELTDLFFRPYTRKAWGLDLSDLDASVVRRLQIRTDREDRYFPGDTFQAMPSDGYTAMFERIFDHPRISVETGRAFDPAMLAACDHCFNSMPIDEYFSYAFGELPYRSIRFHLSVESPAADPGHVTINHTDTGPFTRETWWGRIPGHHPSPGAGLVRTLEEPCDYRENDMERYYPVKTHDGRYEAVYQRYNELAGSLGSMTFIGRCGTYQYLDMHQVVNQSLAGVNKWLAGGRPVT